jgi:gas vesicle protein
MREGLRINPRSPIIKTVKGQQYGSDAGVNMMYSEFSNFSNFKPTMAPWKEYIPATEKSGVAIESKPLEKPVSSPNWGSTTILKDGRHLRAYPDGHTEIVGNPRKVVNVGNLEKKKYGGQMLPKFLVGGESDDLTPEQQYTKTRFMGAEQNQKNLAFNQMIGNTNPGYSTYNSDYEKALQQTRDEVNAQQNKINPPQEEELQLANDVIDKQHGWNRNDLSTRPKSKSKTDPNSKNFDWGNLAMNVGNFAAQNAGNIYNLSRYNKPEETKFKQTTGKYMDPTKAIAGENYIYRQTKNTAPGLTGGNAGATMALLFANKANTATRIGRLRETYDNANAQIANQVNQYNTGIANQEIIANEQNRARARSGTGEAIGDTAKSFAQMQLDNKKGAMDEDMLEVYKEYYKNPEFRAAMKKLTFGSKKK